MGQELTLNISQKTGNPSKSKSTRPGLNLGTLTAFGCKGSWERCSNRKLRDWWKRQRDVSWLVTDPCLATFILEYLKCCVKRSDEGSDFEELSAVAWGTERQKGPDKHLAQLMEAKWKSQHIDIQHILAFFLLFNTVKLRIGLFSVFFSMSSKQKGSRQVTMLHCTIKGQLGALCQMRESQSTDYFEARKKTNLLNAWNKTLPFHEFKQLPVIWGFSSE